MHAAFSNDSEVLQDVKNYRFVPMHALSSKPHNTIRRAQNGETIVVMEDGVPQAMLVNCVDYLKLVRQVNAMHNNTEQKEKTQEPKPKRIRRRV